VNNIENKTPLLRLRLCRFWVICCATSLLQLFGASVQAQQGCGAPCGPPCSAPPRHDHSYFWHSYFWKWPVGAYGHHHTCTVPRGTGCACPPQGPFFGYYPTCWQHWPCGWETCPPPDPNACKEINTPSTPVPVPPGAATPTLPGPTPASTSNPKPTTAPSAESIPPAVPVYPAIEELTPQQELSVARPVPALQDTVNAQPPIAMPAPPVFDPAPTPVASKPTQASNPEPTPTRSSGSISTAARVRPAIQEMKPLRRSAAITISGGGVQDPSSREPIAAPTSEPVPSTVRIRPVIQGMTSDQEQSAANPGTAAQDTSNRKPTRAPAPKSNPSTIRIRPVIREMTLKQEQSAARLLPTEQDPSDALTSSATPTPLGSDMPTAAENDPPGGKAASFESPYPELLYPIRRP
jgi:hypothetical protein